jgi:hypothetical protein
MRTAFALVLVAALGACGTHGTGGGDDGDDTTMMPPDGSTTTTTHDLKLVSPDKTIDPGQEVTFCWYFRADNDKALAIKHWQSTMTPGSHHLILFTSATELMPKDTVTVDCAGMANGGGVWTYSAQSPEAELALPADDGTGKPVAMELAAHQAGFIQVHYNNRSDQAITAHVEVTADALGAGVAYTKTAAYVTYNGEINIPAGSVAAPSHADATMSCSVPATSKFWLMTTHAHKQADHTFVKDGGAAVFDSADWEHPGVKQWTAPFYSFTSGKLTYECTYTNTTPRAIQDGESAQQDEMCMASGYFFPATKPVFCYDNLVF